MALKRKGLRLLRNYLYRRYKQAGQRFRKVNRSFLRAVSPEGDPIKKAPTITSRRSGTGWNQLQPVWVLSTGRTGTHTMTELLNLSPAIDAWHEPSPELFAFSYDYYRGLLNRQEALKMLHYLRDEPVFRSVRDGFIYIETNNRLAYLADLLLELYPGSKFIFIHRNPYQFIRSGMRRAYYDGHLRDPDRIIPKTDNAYAKRWEKMSGLEKVAWNWTEVNKLCLHFMDQLPSRKGMQLSSGELFDADHELINKLFDFIGSAHYHPPSSDINQVLGKKHNAQQQGSFAKPANWTSRQLEQVNEIIAPIAQRLSYTLLTNQKGP